jgi:DNA-binding IscR family transcriptional regulator
VDLAKAICRDPDVKEAFKDCVTAEQYKEKMNELEVPGRELKPALEAIDALRNAGLIFVTSGVGYQHKAGTEKLSIAGIFHRMQGHPFCFVKCKEERRFDPDCPRKDLCRTRLFYQHVGEILSKIFSKITIQEIAGRQPKDWSLDKIMGMIMGES